jgi:hypothetical protein
MPDFDEGGLPYADDIRWRMSYQNPNEPPSDSLAPPMAFDRDSLYAQQIIEYEALIEHWADTSRQYRELAQVAIERVTHLTALVKRQSERLRELTEILQRRRP